MARTVKLSAELIDNKTKEVLLAMQEDLANLRAAFVALTAKLDANHAAASDHAATLNPAALKTQQ